jgi:hypothetical protein
MERAMGIAAMLPGMVRMYELMGAELEKMRNLLSNLQMKKLKTSMRELPAPEPEPEPEPVKTKKKAKKTIHTNYGWPTDPEERKAEMRRRINLSKRRKNAASARRALQKKITIERAAA